MSRIDLLFLALMAFAAAVASAPSPPRAAMFSDVASWPETSGNTLALGALEPGENTLRP